ncbi:carboxymuconolactone decarboxylase family protein [Methanobrevibacter sp.]|jgi:alkylhydroperoxidase/carboxymuconolactone decarboxylase family protein YurZ|uniref:carboxymuconolactone decarboxylase family protein n=1 Tax=Methanobrevibacter sp. TaxID=66852 RepID=UPI00388E0C25
MKKEVFYGKGMGKLKEEDEDLYQAIVALNDAVWNGKALDYKTQKLIAIGIAASNADSRATEKQIMSAKKELGVTRDEVIDVLKVVLLTSGMQPFNKALQIANKVFEE